MPACTHSVASIIHVLPGPAKPDAARMTTGRPADHSPCREILVPAPASAPAHAASHPSCRSGVQSVRASPRSPIRPADTSKAPRFTAARDSPPDRSRPSKSLSLTAERGSACRQPGLGSCWSAGALGWESHVPSAGSDLRLVRQAWAARWCPSPPERREDVHGSHTTRNRWPARPALLPAPAARASGRNDDAADPVAFTAAHHFAVAGSADPAALANATTVPLSVIVQVTKRCDFGCVFCSETLQMADPALEQLDTIRATLAGCGGCSCRVGSRCCAATFRRSAPCSAGSSLGCPPTRPAAWRWRHGWPAGWRSSTLDSIGRVPRSAGSAATMTKRWPAYGHWPPPGCRSRCRRWCCVPPCMRCRTCARSPTCWTPGSLPLRKGNALGLAEREFITVGEAHEVFERLTEL